MDFFSQRSVVLHTGVFVADYGLKQEPPLTGVMLFASYLTRGHRLRDYPTPLLTISGDLDGLTRITRIVETFEYVLLIYSPCYRKLFDNPIYNFFSRFDN